MVFLNEYHKHDAELKKPDIIEYILYYLMYMKFKKQAKPTDCTRSQESGYP